MTRPLIIIGPSGAGKTTVVQALQAKSLLKVVPTWTDRPIRSDETDGEHHFVTTAELQAYASQGYFVHAPVTLFGLPYLYALPKVDGNEAVPACLMLRAGLRQLAERYFSEALVYQIEAPRPRVEEVLLVRQLDGAEPGSRLADYEVEVSAGRAWARRVFINNDLDETVSAVEQALRIDLGTPAVDNKP